MNKLFNGFLIRNDTRGLSLRDKRRCSIAGIRIVQAAHDVLDRINRMHGSETIVIGAQQYTQKNGKGKAEVFARSSSARLLPKGRKNAIKHDFRSKNPTTRWADIIKLH